MSPTSTAPLNSEKLIIYRNQAMNKTFEKMKATDIWRNDRFWIAGDHVVDPRINDLPNVKALIEASEKAKHDFKLTEYQGMNVKL